MKVEPAYISLGANRSSSSSATASSGLVAFGSGKLVALWDSEDLHGRGVHTTLPGHQGHVTTVKLLRDSQGEVEFLSGDAIGSVRVWQGRDGGQFSCTAFMDAHPSSSISALGVPPPTTSGPLSGHFFTGGSDSRVKLWRGASADEKGKGKAVEVQTIDLKGKLPLDIEVGYLPGSGAPILIVACTDRRIQIFTSPSPLSGRWTHILSLEGHEDWVRALHLTPFPSSSSGSSSDLMLASGSQDNYVRLWRICADDRPEVDAAQAGSQGGLEMLDEFERSLGGGEGLGTKKHEFAVEVDARSYRHTISLEALLVGHEASLTNLHWSPSSSPSTNPHLLSSAADNSLIIWTPSSSHSTDGIWIPSHRFGTLNSRSMAFFGALWGKDGSSVLGQGWNGGWERWIRRQGGEGEGGSWEAVAAATGHFGEVGEVRWDPSGRYLLSVSADQTTRIHAPCKLAVASSSRDGRAVWAEIARPQIHGYDMVSAAFISPLRFVSSGDEKVVRIFDAPGGFVDSLESLAVQGKGEGRFDGSSPKERPKGATVPPLGLSNRPLGDLDASDMPETHVSNQAQHSVSQAFTALPTEEELASTTLWPEVEKVYGHGYEIASVDASHNGKLIATACRATNAEHAAVRIVSTDSWDLVGEPLVGHNLTVTRIAFSPDDTRVLTCSRDRGWRIFKRASDSQVFGLEQGEEKAHARMVNDCCWMPDGTGFATASRDKTVKLWRQAVAGDSGWTLSETIKCSEPATAVDVVTSSDGTLLAIGLEGGGIDVYLVNPGQGEPGTVTVSHAHRLQPGLAHSGSVNRLAWRVAEDGGLQLASCGDDRSVRVFIVIP